MSIFDLWKFRGEMDNLHLARQEKMASLPSLEKNRISISKDNVENYKWRDWPDSGMEVRKWRVAFGNYEFSQIQRKCEIH